jgi:glycosyltransferase involved in cell wall biosynthesis
LRIFLIVVYYLPSTKSSAKIIFDLGIELLRCGHEVSIITTSETIKNPFELEIENGLNVLRFRTGKIDGASLGLRFINELLLSPLIWYRGKKYFKENNCDLVIWYSPSIFFSSLIRKIKHQNRCRSYLILRDIFPQWALDIGVLRRGILFDLLHWFEKRQYYCADYIGVQSPNNLAYFNKVSLRNRFNLEVLYNWTSLEKVSLPIFDFRVKYNLLGKIVFFYGGNLGIAQDLDNLIRLAQNLKDVKEAHILIVGEGSEASRLKGKIMELGLRNIEIHGSVTQDLYFAMLSEFDIGLISLDKKFKTTNFPGKMLGYMYFSKPILASINLGNDLQQLIESSNAGLVSINGNDEMFLNNALMLIKNHELRILQGYNGNLLLKNVFSVSSAAKIILKHFE